MLCYAMLCHGDDDEDDDDEDDDETKKPHWRFVHLDSEPFHVFEYTWTCIHPRAYPPTLPTYTHTYVHTYVHTYIHTHIPTPPPPTSSFVPTNQSPSFVLSQCAYPSRFPFQPGPASRPRSATCAAAPRIYVHPSTWPRYVWTTRHVCTYAYASGSRRRADTGLGWRVRGAMCTPLRGRSGDVCVSIYQSMYGYEAID